MNSGTFPKLFSNNQAIGVESSRNVVIDENNYSGNAEITQEMDASMNDLKFQ